MKRSVPFLLASTIILQSCMVSLAADTGEVSINRIAGSGRVETSLEISRYENTSAEKVIIADASNYPDALSASTLTEGKYPILLVQNRLSKGTVEEIERLGAEEVIILGGENSISPQIEGELSSINGVKNVLRLSGKDRYETSAEAFRKSGKTNAVVASGENFPDALAASSLIKDSGLLLTRKNSAPKSVKPLIEESTEKVQIVGGKGSIGSGFYTSLSMKNGYETIYGKDRYSTSVEIAKRSNADTVIVASGENFPDALAASTLSQKTGYPILLVSKNAVNSSVEKYIQDRNIKNAIILGGEGTISQKTEKNIERIMKGEKAASEEKPKAQGKVINNVPYISQLYPLYAPNGCEATSLLMGLKAKGYTNMGLGEFIKAMPKTNNNPKYGFVGDPMKIQAGYYQSIDPEPLANYGKKYGNVVNIQGADIKDIIKEIQNGNTVVLYGTYKWQKPQYNVVKFDGVPTKVIWNTHVVLVTGYDPVKKSFLIADPYNPDKLSGNKKKPYFYWKPQSVIDAAYNYNNRRFAVAIR